VDLTLNGKVVIVTGGTRGIGRAIAAHFRAAGAEVVICARHAATVPPEGALFVQADVREPDEVDRMVAFAVERFGRLDVVVNNAGGAPPADAATASPRFSTAILHLNLLAPLLVAQRANTVMQTQAHGGVILNIASVSGLRASPGSAAYGAAKAGLIHLTQSLAVEWAPKVRVNAITPGLIRTDGEAAQAHYGDAARAAAIAGSVPLGRFGEPAEVADACLYLASPAARYVSGANLVLHGGGERPAWLDADKR
jgi:NAD(P)-dependent dehydrogenase (short-subunit alcohol dehydrogenase family)